MITRRMIIAAGVALAVTSQASFSVGAAEPSATLQSFYDALLATMKDGDKLGFAGRRDKLTPIVRKSFDLPLMTRLIAGLQWPNFSPADQKSLIDAFSDFSVATYASQFDDFSGEQFKVDAKTNPAPGNDIVVHTKLIPFNEKPVQLDYLLRANQGDWRIIDVYLEGTVSQLAARRSEFSSVLRQSGVSGLIAVLKEKTAQLANS